MIGASKILTVSYGTFSCTLEGFDDPFNTMRAIAEYFRELAAEDRYFGAEPPTPDAAMLHRIAEREIQRRVEAKIGDNGVVLRAGDVEVSAPANRPVERTLPQVSEPVVMPGADSVAARLARLRVANGQTAPAMLAAVDFDLADDAAIADGYIEDEHVDDMIISPETAAPMLDLAEPEDADFVAEAAADLPTAPFVEETQPDWGIEPQDLLPDTDPVLESVVEVIADAPAVEPQDDVANDVVTDTVDAVAAGAEDTIASIMAGLRADAVAVEDDLTDTEADLGWSPDDAALAQDIADAALTDLVEPDDAADYLIEDADLHLTGEPDQADILGAMIDPDGDEDDVEPAQAAVALGNLFAPEMAEPDAAAMTEPLVERDVNQTEAALANPAPAPGESQPRARARVIKIRRIEARAARAKLADPTPEPLLEAAEPVLNPSLLSPEAEAELQRELAALEAELAPMAPEEAPEEVPEPAAVIAPPATEAAPEPVEMPTPTVEAAAVIEAAPDADLAEPRRMPETVTEDDAVNRLISQTNTVMAGPENKRRLAAIAHLKAAVAATFADRKANPDAAASATTERMDPYRDDLDRVVRPRRPALVTPQSGQPHQTERPAPLIDRPAPLVLVSEQRIDRPAVAVSPPAHIAPVRPRRVTAAMMAEPFADALSDGDEQDDEDTLRAEDMDNVFADAKGQAFGEFAERLGANTMPELLEAAGAYCALVLGRGQFSRPLLLQQIAHLPDAGEISREDCLRGFGTLLRDGRITKIKRGQFKLSDQSRYLSDAKRQVG